MYLSAKGESQFDTVSINVWSINVRPGMSHALVVNDVADPASNAEAGNNADHYGKLISTYACHGSVFIPSY